MKKLLLTLLLYGLCARGADVKISELPAVTTLADTDKHELVSAGANSYITGANFKLQLHANPGPIGGTTPGTGAFTDLAASNALHFGYSFGTRFLAPLQLDYVDGGYIPGIYLIAQTENTLRLGGGQSTGNLTLLIPSLYTDPSNYEYGSLAMSDTALTISTVTAGSGVDNLDIVLTPAGTGGVKIGAGTAITKVLSAVAAIDFASMLTLTETTATVTVTGVATTNTPSVALGWAAALETGIIVVQSWVSGADTVTIRVRNTTVGTVDPASLTVRATVMSF